MQTEHTPIMAQAKFDQLTARVAKLEEALKACVARLTEDGITETHINSPLALARAALAGKEEK